jgi:hypothetical protein
MLTDKQGGFASIAKALQKNPPVQLNRNPNSIKNFNFF